MCKVNFTGIVVTNVSHKLLISAISSLNDTEMDTIRKILLGVVANNSSQRIRSSQPWLHNKFMVYLGFMRSCVREIDTETETYLYLTKNCQMWYYHIVYIYIVYMCIYDIIYIYTHMIFIIIQVYPRIKTLNHIIVNTSDEEKLKDSFFLFL